MVEKGGKVSDYIKERMKQLEKPRIATADEVLQKFTEILRQELKEEVNELNPITGEFVTIEKSPSIREVIMAGKELMKRYPRGIDEEINNLQREKLRLENLKLEQDVTSSETEESQFNQLKEIRLQMKGMVKDD